MRDNFGVFEEGAIIKEMSRLVEVVVEEAVDEPDDQAGDRPAADADGPADHLEAALGC